MKYRKIIWWVVVFGFVWFMSCKKNRANEVFLPGTPVDYSNVNLRIQPLDTIRKAVKGQWQIHYSMVLGWGGWSTFIDMAHFISFLPGDTVKRVYNGNITIYEKAILKRVVSPVLGDTVYQYTFISSPAVLIPDKIFNDTLKIEWGSFLLFGTRKN